MSGSKRPRGLRPDEDALWRKVVENATQIRRAAPLNPISPPKKVAPPKDQVDPLPQFKLGEKATHTDVYHDLAAPLPDRLAKNPVRMDKRAFGRMRRGKLIPEARIDLHGMTLSTAHPALVRFILDSHAMGRRLVLVITGKGRGGDDQSPIPVRPGVLKYQVPEWLRSGVLASAVLQVTEAHVRHGGSGAYYVYLRRGR